MSLVAWYKFANNFNDEGGLYNGSAVGHTTFAEIAGTPNQYSASFDGNDDIIALGNSANLIPPQMSISCWAYLINSVGANRAFVSRWDSAGGVNQRCFVLEKFSDNKVYFRITSDGSTGGTSAASSVTLSNDTWYHIVGTWDGAVIKVYVDNVLRGQNNHATGIFASTNQSVIGGVAGRVGTDSIVSDFYGYINDCRIYNHELSVAEIDVLFTYVDSPDASGVSAATISRLVSAGAGDGGAIGVSAGTIQRLISAGVGETFQIDSSPILSTFIPLSTRRFIALGKHTNQHTRVSGLVVTDFQGYKANGENMYEDILFDHI